LTVFGQLSIRLGRRRRRPPGRYSRRTRPRPIPGSMSPRRRLPVELVLGQCGVLLVGGRAGAPPPRLSCPPGGVVPEHSGRCKSGGRGQRPRSGQDGTASLRRKGGQNFHGAAGGLAHQEAGADRVGHVIAAVDPAEPPTRPSESGRVLCGGSSARQRAGRVGKWPRSTGLGTLGTGPARR
jgi:hypothetical protein